MEAHAGHIFDEDLPLEPFQVRRLPSVALALHSEWQWTRHSVVSGFATEVRA
jgi:hypothetical protein